MLSNSRPAFTATTQAYPDVVHSADGNLWLIDTANGKPQVFYDGAEYCPFCAAARWGMIVSLSRFGTFSGLKTVHSSTTDNPPNIPTWTFYGSTYTSKYINFTPVEETTNTIDSSTGNYGILRRWCPEDRMKSS